MSTKLNLQSRNDKLYLPEAAEIIEIRTLTEKEKLFRLSLKSGKSLGHHPGQFVQMSILGIGEAAISISSPPSTDSKFDLCVRQMGEVTSKLHTMQVGDILHIRGPFGHGINDEIQKRLLNKHILLAMGGTGYFPLRSLLNKIVPERKKYKKISVLYGCRNPKEILFPDEIARIKQIGDNIEFLQTVDKAEADWQGNCGVITTLVPKVKFDPQDTIAIMAGPPIMFKFMIKALLEKGLLKENIYIDLERRMKCGVGKCGHCQMGGCYVCQEGSVFNYAEVENNEELF
jgi:sulfhydrogenase subunit gamma (sulfur reductase)